MSAQQTASAVAQMAAVAATWRSAAFETCTMTLHSLAHSDSCWRDFSSNPGMIAAGQRHDGPPVDAAAADVEGDADRDGESLLIAA
jgi:hypothetical protein